MSSTDRDRRVLLSPSVEANHSNLALARACLIRRAVALLGLDAGEVRRSYLFRCSGGSISPLGNGDYQRFQPLLKDSHWGTVLEVICHAIFHDHLKVAFLAAQLELHPRLPQGSIEFKSDSKPRLDLSAVPHGCFAGDLDISDHGPLSLSAAG
jgi:hypothetical protein